MRHDPIIDLELNRAFAMSAEWDEAASALARHDFRAFDEAMARFRQLEHPVEFGERMRRENNG